MCIMFNMGKNEPFINNYIWELRRWPAFKFEEHTNFVVSQIYHYNSLEDGMENVNINNIHLPQMLIQNFDAFSDVLSKNMGSIIKNYIPIIRRINDDLWIIDDKLMSELNDN